MDISSAAQTSKNEDTESMSITLRSSETGNTTTTHPNRTIVLTRARPSISIGRASKVTSKGFVAGDSNGYFDSPVMSRQHAELLADFDKKKINIKDSGSLHGTFHTVDNGLRKESKLEPGKVIEVRDQDRLRFGIDIFRSNVTFPPTILTVEIGKDYYQGPDLERTTNRFSVPDDIDSEDDMFSQISDDACVVETRHEPEAIDLTDDSAQRHSELRHVIDLTAERGQFLNAYDQTLDLLEIDEVEEIDEDIDEIDAHDSIMSEGSMSGESIDYGNYSSDDEDESAPHSEIDDESDDNEDDVQSHTSSMHEDDLNDNTQIATSAQPSQSTRGKSPSDFIFQSPTDLPAEPEAIAPEETSMADVQKMEAVVEATMQALPQTNEVDLEPPAASNESAWTNSGVGFINDPNAVLPLSGAKLHEQLPALDETSAFTYEQSKAAGQTVRRVLISDLLSQPQAVGEIESTAANVASEVTSVKRSFEDAFPVDEVEKVEQKAEHGINMAAPETSQQVVVDRRTLRTLSRKIATPIPKRRRIAEVAACLALGGAGVLSALIYTAPSFA